MAKRLQGMKHNYWVGRTTGPNSCGHFIKGTGKAELFPTDDLLILSGVVPCDQKAKHFIVRVDGGHDPHAIDAVLYYARLVEDSNPKYAAELQEWVEEVAK